MYVLKIYDKDSIEVNEQKDEKFRLILKNRSKKNRISSTRVYMSIGFPILITNRSGRNVFENNCFQLYKNGSKFLVLRLFRLFSLKLNPLYILLSGKRNVRCGTILLITNHGVGRNALEIKRLI